MNLPGVAASAQALRGRYWASAFRAGMVETDISETTPRVGSDRGAWQSFRRWQIELRARVVRRGIQVACGSADFVPTSAAADVPLITGGLRFAWLKGLAALGVEHFVSRSGFGHKFVCHVGDLAEFPFYHRRAFERELMLCLGWLHQEERPVIYDLGANVGFVATQLAQMLEPQSPRIYAFEPVPATFARLVKSITLLGLDDHVQAIPAALTAQPGSVQIAYSTSNSLMSQVRATADAVTGETIVDATGVTLDAFSAEIDRKPSLLKMDIEGSEIAALSGARRLLSGPDRPAIAFEHNPVALAECGTHAGAFLELLPDYAFHYVDDLAGQLRPFGSPVADLGQIGWICNLFAVPRGPAAAARWAAALDYARGRLSQ